MANQTDGELYVVERGLNHDKFYPMEQKVQNMIGWDPTKSHVLFPYAPSLSKKNYPLAQQVVESANIELKREIELHSECNEPHEIIPFCRNAADVLLMTSKREVHSILSNNI